MKPNAIEFSKNWSVLMQSGSQGSVCFSILTSILHNPLQIELLLLSENISWQPNCAFNNPLTRTCNNSGHPFFVLQVR
eukprot:2068050-Amphidinium_carterae.3